MARSTEQIHTEMMAERSNRLELQVLNTISRTSLYGGMLWLVAFGINLLEQFFDMFQAEVQTKLDQKEPGTPSWYAAKLLEFQDGDPLIIRDGIITYSQLDPAKRIISRAAFKETGGALTLKCAKGEIGSEEALSADELIRANNYLERYKYAGSTVNLISLNADKLRTTGIVYYNGIYTATQIKTLVEAALRNYIIKLDFDGIVRRIKIIDAIQAVEGVVDLDLNISVKAGTTLTPVPVNHETASGYLAEDDEVPFADLSYVAV